MEGFMPDVLDVELTTLPVVVAMELSPTGFVVSHQPAKRSTITTMPPIMTLLFIFISHILFKDIPAV
jgi:hypothetical protein